MSEQRFVQSAIYANILEDIKKGNAIIEETDRVYRTADAAIYSGFANTSNVYNIQTKDEEKILLPSESMLRVVFSLANAAGDGLYAPYDTVAGPFVDPESVHKGVATLISGGLHLFDQARLMIDNNQVELVNKPGFVHVVDHLLTSSLDHIRASNENEWLWFDDGGITTGLYTAGVSTASYQAVNTYAWNGTAAQTNESYGFADPTPYLADDPATGTGSGGFNPKYNHGFAMRWARTQTKLNTLANPHLASHDTSVEVELAIPITRLFGYFADIRSAYRGVKFEIELVKNTNYTEIIHGRGTVAELVADYPAADLATVVIKRIEWAIPTVIPSTSVLEEMNSSLISGQVARKVFSSTQVYMANYLAATTDIDWRIQTTGKKISRVVFGFQREAQYASQNDPNLATPASLHSNGGVFSKLTDITKVELRLGPTILPKEPYSGMTFAAAAPNVARNYVEFLQTGGVWMGDNDSIVSYDKYRDIYPLFCFDLSKTSIDSSIRSSQDMRFIATVSAPSNFRVIALVTYDYDVDFAGIDGRIAVKLP